MLSLLSAGTETAQCVPISAVLFPPCLAGRQDMLVLAAALNPVGSECGNIQDILPPVDLHPPAATPLHQPIHFNPELMYCACLTD